MSDDLTVLARPTRRQIPGAVAPTWHTVVMLLVIALLSGLSAYSHGPSPAGISHGAVFRYLAVMITEWVVLGFAWLGIRLRDLRIRDLIGGDWPKWTALARDLGLAVVFLILSNILLAGVAHLFHADSREVARRLLPHGRTETVVYLLLCGTAGFCEEVLFRGYLQKQLTAWTRNATAGLLLQALAFGAGHGYQGPKLMAVITVYGCLFGLLAQRRRSLRPGMIAHFMQDSLVGLASRLR